MQRARLLAVTLGLLVLGGCGQADDTADEASPSAAPSTAPSSELTPTSGSSSSSAEPPGRCTTAGLKLSLSRGDGAAGSTYYLLQATNASAEACRLGGFGGVSFVAKPGGTPIGASADRVQRAAVRVLTLMPRDMVQATLRETNADNFSRDECRPTPAKGLRVYPPNETHSTYLRHVATACASKSVHLLELSPYRRPG